MRTGAQLAGGREEGAAGWRGKVAAFPADSADSASSHGVGALRLSVKGRGW